MRPTVVNSNKLLFFTKKHRLSINAVNKIVKVGKIKTPTDRFYVF